MKTIIEPFRIKCIEPIRMAGHKPDDRLPVQVLRHAKAALRTEVAQDSKGREMSWARGREERPNTGRRRIRRDRPPIAPH